MGAPRKNLAESVWEIESPYRETRFVFSILVKSSREHLRQGRISAGHARAALGAPNPDPVVDMAVAKEYVGPRCRVIGETPEDGGALDTVANKVNQVDKDVDTEALESDLARVLGLKVDIRQGYKGGELRIRYGDLEQLDELCRRLTAKR